jgi:beta-phosphoglucomutase-like phosphatase (HAD superfamily)
MRFTLGLTGLYERFYGRIFSATEVARGKPAPDLFLYAADRMGVQPTACVVVEDSVHGVAAARAAGMHVFVNRRRILTPDRRGILTPLIRDHSRCLNRQESLPVSMISQ